MIKYIVIGDPVAHSRSPGMQNAAFSACGLGTPYGIRHVTPAELPDFFEFARKNLRGVNITVPHKLAAFKLADELTPRARLCGSVNTLIIENNRILGDSTDGVGLQCALEYHFNLPVQNRNFLFLGAGGAAQATAIHLAASGAAGITLVNRTISKAEALAGLIANAAPECRCTVMPKVTAEALQGADFLIQATSLGLKADDPVPMELDLLTGSLQLAVFDTIYRQTPLLQRAAAVGLPCAGGKEMLIQQGAASFKAWTGITPSLDAMRAGFELPPGGIEI